ncbi:hypothetical protein EDB85DRAFT_1397511 [Lactarius pseudohatsudake]|nr:hypothetical protein EDB85DRAFT_1397511 [Lactarius pseudohatsudake]
MKWRFLVPLARRHVSGRSHPPGRDLASDTKPRFFDREARSASRPVSTSLPRIYLITRFHVHASFAATPDTPLTMRLFLSPPLPVPSRRIPLPPAQRLLNRRHTVMLPRKAKVSDSQRRRDIHGILAILRAKYKPPSSPFTSRWVGQNRNVHIIDSTDAYGRDD